MSGANQLSSFEQTAQSDAVAPILAVEPIDQSQTVGQAFVVKPPRLLEPTEPTESIATNEFVLPQEFSLQKMAYLVDRDIRPYQIPTYVLAGTADLKLIINQLRLTTEGNELLMLVRPFTYSMVLYLRVTLNKKIVCFIGDSQALQLQFYPTKNIVDILCAQWGDAIEVYLPQTVFQSKIISSVNSKEFNFGSGILSIEMLRYFSQYGERFIQELVQSRCIDVSGVEGDKLPQQVKLLAADVLPEHFVQTMKAIFSVTAESSANTVPIITSTNFSASSIMRRMQDYSVDPAVEAMSIEHLHRLQFFGTTPERLNIETPHLYANKIFIERVFSPTKKSTEMSSANPENNSNQNNNNITDRYCYRLTYRFADQQTFLYENNLIFSHAQFPADVTIPKLRCFMSEQVKIDDENYTLTITANSLNELTQKLNRCDTPAYLHALMQEGFTQCAALRRFIAEAKEFVQIYQIKLDFVQGGLGLDCVNRALLYLLATHSAIFVPTEHFNTVDQEQLQAFITSNDVKQYEYIVFSFPVNQVHQIAVIVDYKQKCVKLIDSEGRDYSYLIKQRFTFPNGFTIINAPAFSRQNTNWSCGIDVILNILNELQLLNSSIVDVNNFDQILRIVLRASDHIADERLRLSAQQQKQQQMKDCLLQHSQVQQDNTLCDSLIVLNKPELTRARRSRSIDLMELVTAMSSFMVYHEPKHRAEMVTRILANLPSEQEYDLSFQAIYKRERDLGVELDAYWGSSLELLLKGGDSAVHFLYRLIDDVMSSDNWLARFNAEFKRNKAELMQQAERERNSAELKPPTEFELNKTGLSQIATLSQLNYLTAFIAELSVEKMLIEYQFQLCRGIRNFLSNGEVEYIVPLTAKFIIFKLMHRMVTNLEDYRNRSVHDKTNCLVVDRKHLEYTDDKLQRYYIEQLTHRLEEEKSLPLDLKHYQDLIARLCLPGARSVVFKFEALRWKAEFMSVLHLEFIWLEQAVFQHMASHLDLISTLPLSVQFFVALTSSNRLAQADEFRVKNQAALTLAMTIMSVMQLFKMMLVIPIALRLTTLQKLAEILPDQHPLKATFSSLIAIYSDNPQPENQFHAALFALFEQELKTFQDVITAIKLCHKSVRFLYLKPYLQLVTSYQQLRELMPLLESHQLLALTQLKHDLITTTSDIIILEGYFKEADKLTFVLRFFDDIAQHPLDSIRLLVEVHRIDASTAEQRFKLHLPLILQHTVLLPLNNILNDNPQMFRIFRQLFLDGLVQQFHTLHSLKYERLIELLKLLSTDGLYAWEQHKVTGAAAEAVCDLAIKARDLCTTVANFVSVITILPDAVKYRYFEAIQDKITSSDVTHIVLAMPPSNQLSAAKKLQHLIKTYEHLDRVFRVLSVAGDEDKLIIAMADKEFNDRPALCLTVMEKLHEYECKSQESISQTPPEQHVEKFVTKNMAHLLDVLLEKELVRSTRKIVDQYRLLFIAGLLKYADTLKKLTTDRLNKFRLPDDASTQLAIEFLPWVTSHAQMKIFYHLIPEHCSNHILSLLSKLSNKKLVSDDIVIILYSFCQFKFAGSASSGEKVAEYLKEKFELFPHSQRVLCAHAVKQKLKKLIKIWGDVFAAQLQSREFNLEAILVLIKDNLSNKEKYSDAMFFIAAISVLNPYFDNHCVDKYYQFSTPARTNTQLRMFQPIPYAVNAAHSIVQQLQQGELPLLDILRDFQQARTALAVDMLGAYLLRYILNNQPIFSSSRSNDFWSSSAKLYYEKNLLDVTKTANINLSDFEPRNNLDLCSIKMNKSSSSELCSSLLSMATNKDLSLIKRHINRDPSIIKQLLDHAKGNDVIPSELLIPINRSQRIS